MVEFTMPSLGADMEVGTLVEWRKKPGDPVQRGDIIAEVETDKGIIEVEVFTDGTVEKWLVQPGTKVPVGTPLALIRQEGDTTAAPSNATGGAAMGDGAPGEAATAPASMPSSSALAQAPSPSATREKRVRATPAARRLARERDVDLSELRGTGPHGSITREDVAAAAPSARPAAAGPTLPAAAQPTDTAARMRQAIGAAMARSKREIPHYYVGTRVDMTPALDWLSELNGELPVPDRVLPVALLLKSVAVALKRFPELNGYYENGRYAPSSDINVGAAIALRGGGLVAPALARADALPLVELMRRFRDLVTRARGGSLRGSEFSAGTITVTSLGDRGSETVYGAIYPPQVAIVGFGKIVERPWVVHGQVVPRQTVTATLSADHRVSDGHRGALFLDALDRHLQTPEELA